MLTLLQITAPVDSTTQTVPKSTFDSIILGGWAMIPLAILLIIAVFIFIERLITIRKASGGDSEDLTQQVRRYVLQGNIEAAKGLCESVNNPFSRMLLKGLNRLGSASLKDIEGSIENVGRLEIYRLERRLSFLATIAGAAPMWGFFGTVYGMIQAFGKIAESKGTPDPSQLAEGISIAMLTTAGGLIVGILAYLGYNSLVGMINRVIYKLELTSTDFLDLLQEPAN